MEAVVSNIFYVLLQLLISCSLSEYKYIDAANGCRILFYSGCDFVEETEKFHTVRGYQLLEQNKRLLTPAMEDYLEMIYRNSLVEGYVRINTLSGQLNVQAPSATRMVQKLAALELLYYKRYGIIFLTENGREIGKFLLERHRIIETFLRHLGVGDSILLETELIEHNITASTLQKIDLLNKFFESDTEMATKFTLFKKAISELHKIN